MTASPGERTAPAGAGGLRAGYAAVEITPPAGVDMTGFIAREGPCLGRRDPLEVRALVFEDGAGRRVAVAACDLIGLGRHTVARVRRRVAAAAGIPPEGQLFNCSHTHAGPETGVLTTIGAPDPAYLESLEARLGDALIAAAARLVPVRLHVGTTEVPDGLVLNRVFRRIDDPGRYDRQLVAVRVEPVATIVAFACHAVALGSRERYASADFVAPLRRALEGAGADGAPASGPVVYLNGCGGDVNPAGMDARGEDACEALGLGLARAARTALAAAGPASGAPPVVDGRQEWVTLPFQPLRTPGEAATILAAGQERIATQSPGSPAYRGTRVTDVEYPLRLLRLHYGSETLPEVRAEVQALKIGPLAVVALPGEIFSSLGRAIKAGSPFGAPRTLVAGWANDNVGYVPDAEAYPLGGYEVDLASRYYGHPAGWAPEAGQGLVATATRLLEGLAAT
jgi:hypothetical protein